MDIRFDNLACSAVALRPLTFLVERESSVYRLSAFTIRTEHYPY